MSFCGYREGWITVNRFNRTSWMTVVTPIDRPKSIRNRCVSFGSVFVLSITFRYHTTEPDLLLFLNIWGIFSLFLSRGNMVQVRLLSYLHYICIITICLKLFFRTFVLLSIDFGFPIVNFPWLNGDVPRLPSNGIYISQLVRFARCCTNAFDFHSKNLQITS